MSLEYLRITALNKFLCIMLIFFNLFLQTLVKELRKFGHDAKEWNMGMMSIIIGVQRREDNYLYANSDYRKGGDVGGF